MEKSSSEEKRKAEAATGVVSRKASPDGYRYEDGETGKPVDPQAYKVPYLEHVRAVRASRVREFAAQRATAPPPASAVPEAVTGSTAEAGVIASVDSGAVSPAATRGKVGEARLEGEVIPAAPAADGNLATGAANVVVAEGSPEEATKLPDGVSLPDADVLAAEVRSDDVPLKEAGDAANSAEEDKVGMGGTGVEAQDDDACLVGEVDSPAVFFDAGPIAPATPATVVDPDEGIPAAAATSITAVETPIAVEQEPVAATGTVGERDAAEGGAVCAESETLIAVAPTALIVGGVEDDGEDEHAAEEGVKARGETLGGSPAVEAGDEVETPCSSSAAGDACTPGAASAASEPVSTRPEEPQEDCNLRDAAIASLVSHVDQTNPHCCRSNSNAAVSSRQGDGISSSHPFEAQQSRVSANDGGIVSPITASPGSAEPSQGEACGDDHPLSFGDSSGEGDGLELLGGREAVASGSSSPSPRRKGPSPRGSGEHDASDEGSTVAAPSPFSTSPLVAVGGCGQQQDGPLSGPTPEPVERAHRELPSREWPTPPYPFSNAGSPTASEIAASPGEDEEGAEEIAALKERLWAAWDAAVLEYEKGVALVRSRYNRHASSTPAASTTAQEVSGMVVSRSPVVAADPTPAVEVRETSSQEERAPAAGSEAATTPSAASAVEAAAEEPAPAVVVAPTAADGMPTPDSPLLPLLQLRLEEEEGDLFEYSSSWRGPGAGGDGSSQARGGKTRRRSLAKAFSSQKIRQGPKVQEMVSVTAGKSPGPAEAGAQETDESEAGGSGGSNTTAALCRLCCRKACDTMLRPCEHEACGVCVEKIRLQAEQSGQALSCPWDRKLVDAVCPL